MDLYLGLNVQAGPSNFVCCAASLPCPDVVDERLAQPSQGPFTQRECRSWTPNTTYSGTHTLKMHLRGKLAAE